MIHSTFSPKDFPTTELPTPPADAGTNQIQKQAAIYQFVQRYKTCKGNESKNEDRQAGDPMVYHCRHCGMVSDILPEDYFLAIPRSVCSLCERMQPWIEEATQLAQGMEKPCQ